jgi:L,D-transpeptidase ErfK/SrfK
MMKVMINRYKFLRMCGLSSLLLLCVGSSAFAQTFVLPSKNTMMVGNVTWTQALPGDTFNTLGRRFDLGYAELLEANPGVDPKHLAPGTIIVIPSRFILPPGPRHGLVINLAELRIYYYPAKRAVVETYPVGIGREGWDTPLGPSWIAQKMINPTWVVPPAIREDRKKEGVYLPKQVPPGPDNPLGGYALRLKQLTYLIHGTNDSEGIGRRSSAGCLRMYPEDIEHLFPQIKTKDPVYIINVPNKLARQGHRLYLEAHVPLQTYPLAGGTWESLLKKQLQTQPYASIPVDGHLVESILHHHNGIPQQITSEKKRSKVIRKDKD